jgi:hypothetical protein
VGGYPTTVIIDREGKVAFASNEPSNGPAIQAAVKKGPRPEDDQRGASFSALRTASRSGD